MHGISDFRSEALIISILINSSNDQNMTSMKILITKFHKKIFIYVLQEILDKEKFVYCKSLSNKSFSISKKSSPTARGLIKIGKR